jgi:hypothetical protein
VLSKSVLAVGESVARGIRTVTLNRLTQEFPSSPQCLPASEAPTQTLDTLGLCPISFNCDIPAVDHPTEDHGGKPPARASVSRDTPSSRPNTPENKELVHGPGDTEGRRQTVQMK